MAAQDGSLKLAVEIVNRASPDFTGHPKIIEKPERDRFRRA
jgi:hypothetical protein